MKTNERTTVSAFQPYGALFTEIYHHVASSDCALRTAVAARRIRNRVVNTIYARLPQPTGAGARGKDWIRHTLAR